MQEVAKDSVRLEPKIGVLEAALGEGMASVLQVQLFEARRHYPRLLGEQEEEVGGLLIDQLCLLCMGLVELEVSSLLLRPVTVLPFPLPDAVPDVGSVPRTREHPNLGYPV